MNDDVEATERLRAYNEADEAVSASIADRLAEFMESHLSPRGVEHIGTQATCISADCTPPSLPVREGDVVRVDMPYRDTSGSFCVTAETDDCGVVTLVFERP